MTRKLKLFQPVVATRDLTEPDLVGAQGRGKRAIVDGKPGVSKGTAGAIVEIFEEAGGVAVEFFDDDGETIDVALIPEGYVRPATKEETKRAQAITDRLNRDPESLDSVHE